MRKRLFSIVFMFVITLVCTGILTVISHVSAERIELARKARMQRLILAVLAMPPTAGASDRAVSRQYDSMVRKREKDGRTIYLGLSSDHKSVFGYAFTVSGPGFWGPIHGMMGVSSDLSRVLGVAFYDHQETPGLGGRIDEPWFRQQFAGKPLTPSPDGVYFHFTTPGMHERPTDVDAITGATETSRRLSKFLNQDLSETLRWLAKNRNSLVTAPL